MQNEIIKDKSDVNVWGWFDIEPNDFNDYLINAVNNILVQFLKKL